MCADSGVSDSPEEAFRGNLSQQPWSPRQVESSLGDNELHIDSTALMTVPLPVKDDLFYEIFGSAKCAPKLESGISQRVIVLATRCAVRTRARCKLWDYRLREVSVEAGAMDAYRYS